MIALRIFLGAALIASFLFFVPPAAAETYPLIIKGKVTMPDGSPPPFTVGIEKVCSDLQGSAPGPITDKKGEYLWRMNVDPLATRACYIRATHTGYTSTSIDVSALNGYTNTVTTLETLVISSRVADPYSIISSDSGIPSKAGGPWKAAMKALDSSNFPEAATQMQAAVAAAPKFAIGWHALGVVQEKLQKFAEARDAYEHAIEADPKMLPPYATLARLCLRTKDWQGAAKASDALIKVDSKKVYQEAYLHQAVARYGLKDWTARRPARKRPSRRRIPRAEYVLGRILEAKGDAAGAREHISKYLDLDKNTPDAELIRAHLENIGKPGANAALEPELLELPF